MKNRFFALAALVVAFASFASSAWADRGNDRDINLRSGDSTLIPTPYGDYQVHCEGSAVVLRNYACAGPGGTHLVVTAVFASGQSVQTDLGQVGDYQTCTRQAATLNRVN